MSASKRLRLRVSPGAARASVVGRRGAVWKLRVAAPADHGRANDAVVALLAAALRLPRSEVAILAGHAARDKVVTIGRLDLPEIERRLEEAAFPTRAGTA